MAIALDGWLDGITASLIVLFGLIFGLFFIYKSIKLKAKLLCIAGINVVFIGFIWLGPTFDFLVKLNSDTNLSPVETYVFLKYTWFAPALLFSAYIGGELLIPKYKWLLVVIFIVLGTIFGVLVWYQPFDSFKFIEVREEDGLIQAGFNMIYPTFILLMIFLIVILVFMGIGCAVKAKQATGLLRKKFLYLSIGYIIFVVVSMLEVIFTVTPIVGIIRIAMTTYAIWMYLGLKT
ncbi:MAG: hypothetical protein ACFFCE_06895 [Promethearchaeota archaeon]